MRRGGTHSFSQASHPESIGWSLADRGETLCGTFLPPASLRSSVKATGRSESSGPCHLHCPFECQGSPHSSTTHSSARASATVSASYVAALMAQTMGPFPQNAPRHDGQLPATLHINYLTFLCATQSTDGGFGRSFVAACPRMWILSPSTWTVSSCPASRASCLKLAWGSKRQSLRLGLRYTNTLRWRSIALAGSLAETLNSTLSISF